MALPGTSRVELPLLKVLSESSGGLRVGETAQLVAGYFTQITAKDQIVKLKRGQNRWKNRIQWTQVRLKQKGELSNPSRGIWKITSKGAARLQAEWSTRPSGALKHRTIHDRVVQILYDLAKKHKSYKEVCADNIGVHFRPLDVISPHSKGVRPEVLPYNPDVWGKLRNNTLDVYEVWDSQGEWGRAADCVQDILFPALTEDIATLSIVCFDQGTADYAKRLARIILPSVMDGQGSVRLDTKSVLPFVVTIPNDIQNSVAKMEQFLGAKLNLP